jgi:hypothetical protein
LLPTERRPGVASRDVPLDEACENREHDLFGADRFESMVERVAAIEKQLGIFELGQFTPKV